VVASKGEQFVIGTGTIEAQSLADRRWFVAADLSDHLGLPVNVPPNREWTDRIDGLALVKKLLILTLLRRKRPDPGREPCVSHGIDRPVS
jgi:hypothetical protein